jgi:hypothetical protein
MARLLERILVDFEPGRGSAFLLAFVFLPARPGLAVSSTVDLAAPRPKITFPHLSPSNKPFA